MLSTCKQSRRHVSLSAGFRNVFWCAFWSVASETGKILRNSAKNFHLRWEGFCFCRQKSWRRWRWRWPNKSWHIKNVSRLLLSPKVEVQEASLASLLPGSIAKLAKTRLVKTVASNVESSGAQTWYWKGPNLISRQLPVWFHPSIQKMRLSKSTQPIFWLKTWCNYRSCHQSLQWHSGEQKMCKTLTLGELSL